MKKKIRIGILFGGKSTEHEVSIQSAKSIYQVLNKEKYDCLLIGIDRQGSWHELSEKILLSNTHLASIKNSNELSVSPGGNGILKNKVNLGSIDVIFPVLHGTNGEDGSVQGMLQMLDIPCVGSDVLGSAIGMSKDVTKRLLKESGIEVADFFAFKDSQKPQINFSKIKKRLGLPFFVKPSNLGSSVGVSKVKNKIEFEKALLEAFSFDRKILCEKYINGREIECSVLGNDDPIASQPGEIIPVGHEFYTYESKYLDENGYRLIIPAKIPKKVSMQIQTLAVKVFKTLECSGMARIDFFMTQDYRIIVNEINTIPGFTKISMYPKLWEASGISYSKLVDELIKLAIEKHHKQKQTVYSK